MTISETIKRVGELKCQQEPYLKQFKTKVVSCTLNEQKQYEVELEDTILFPEGGGQLWDLGMINDIPVIKVLRIGLRCIHILLKPLEEGQQVEIVLDFKRRWDHMQQHSGQHLLSAVLEKYYQIDTPSWGMGNQKNYVELPIPNNKLSNEMLNEIENLCNEKIRQAIPFQVKSYDLSDPKVQRPSSLPEDYGDGIVREIIIEDLDCNPCCGTHVSNTSELQLIKLFNMDKHGPSAVRLFFMVGQRVIEHIQSSYLRDQNLTSLLNAGPERFAEKIEYLVASNKENNKTIKAINLELNQQHKQAIINKFQKQDVVCIHNPYATQDFIKFINFEFKKIIEQWHNDNKLLIVSAGTASGPVMLLGNSQRIQGTLKKLEEKPDVQLKGAMSGTFKWQGKSTDLQKLIPNYKSIESDKQ